MLSYNKFLGGAVMDKSFFKLFKSHIKEYKWLNDLGAKGYLLKSINDGKYNFEISEEHTYSYSVEYLDFAVESDKAIEYYAEQKTKGIDAAVYSGNWVYFVKTDGEIEKVPGVYKNNAVPYGRKAFFELFFAFVGCIVTGYQIHMISFLNSVGQGGSSQVISFLTKDKGILGVLIQFVNILVKIGNGYFNIWFKLFGSYKPVAVIAVIAPITLVLLILGGCNVDNYAFFRHKYKKLKEKEKDEKDAEQAI